MHLHNPVVEWVDKWEAKGGGRGAGRGGPPPAVFTACEGKASGAACSFVGRGGQTMTGICSASPGQQSGGLACRPSNMGGMGGGGMGGRRGPQG